MTVSVLFFAQARDRAGCSECVLELPEDSRISDALARILGAYPGLAPLAPHLAIAMDGELVPQDTPVRAGAELAMLPPVSGG